MLQGFGGLIARYGFDRDFGVLHRMLDGGALTAAQIAMGVVGVALVVFGIRAHRKA